MDYNKTFLNEVDNKKYHKVLLKAYRKQHSIDKSYYAHLMEPGYIAVTHKGFSDDKNSFDNSLQIAILVTISSFNYFLQDKMMSDMINLNMIMDRLNFSGNISRKRQEVKVEINNMINKGIITVTDMSRSEVDNISDFQPSQLMNIAQKVEKKGSKNFTYYQVKKSEFANIVMSDLKDNEKINVLATLCSIKATMNNTKIDSGKSSYTLAELNKYKGLFCLSSQSRIASRAKVGSRKTIVRYIQILEDMKIIKPLKVHRVDDSSSVWSYYYSDFERFDEFTYFLESLINTGFAHNSSDSNHRDFSYLNIDKVYNDGINIVKDKEGFKVRD